VGPKTACMVGLMWPKKTGAKGNSDEVQNKCACERRWNSRAARFAGSRYVRARLAAQFGYCGNKIQECKVRSDVLVCYVVLCIVLCMLGWVCFT
jgi:hypothetical protein